MSGRWFRKGELVLFCGTVVAGFRSKVQRLGFLYKPVQEICSSAGDESKLCCSKEAAKLRSQSRVPWFRKGQIVFSSGSFAAGFRCKIQKLGFLYKPFGNICSLAGDESKLFWSKETAKLVFKTLPPRHRPADLYPGPRDRRPRHYGKSLLVRGVAPGGKAYPVLEQIQMKADFAHWLVISPFQVGDYPDAVLYWLYVFTLSQVVGCEEKARKMIYAMHMQRFCGFGCQIDNQTADKLEGVPGVLSIIPDSYRDLDLEDFGGYLLSDGCLVVRAPEVQERLDDLDSNPRSVQKKIFYDRTKVDDIPPGV